MFLNFGTVKSLVGKIVREFGTNDVFALAEKAGLKIVYESWHPVTFGEFERKTKTIRINVRALEDEKNAAQTEKKIIAHELGHFFAGGLKLSKTEEEKFADDFATHLLQNKLAFCSGAQ